MLAAHKGFVDTDNVSTEIYPVVHVNDARQAAEQSTLAYELGADGVYLIDHNHPTTDELIKAFTAVDEAHPDNFIGLNFLQLSNGLLGFKRLLKLTEQQDIRRLPDGLWVDDASTLSEETTELRQEQPELTRVKYLGGVAFKYTVRYTDDPLAAAMQARNMTGRVDVITTSGPGTGEAASAAKIWRMKEAIKSQRLAVASGISEDNLHLFRDHLDEILVSTSVETQPGSGIFDPARLSRLIEMAHEL